MLACSQLVDMVPGNDAKFFQATQVVDEARHAEVLSRYLLEKCGGRIYPMTGNIKTLFDYILGQGKWFIKTVGLQLLAETFAVSLFRMLMETAQGPAAARDLQAHPGRRIAAHGILDSEPARRDSRRSAPATCASSRISRARR